MKHFLKKYERYLSVHHYIAVLRRQPAHMQHLYAILFAGCITGLIAMVILYFDYGFWHERYTRAEDIVEVHTTGDPMVTVQSPGEMIGGFFREASDKLKNINVSSTSLLEGKDTYSRDEGEAGSQ